MTITNREGVHPMLNNPIMDRTRYLIPTSMAEAIYLANGYPLSIMRSSEQLELNTSVEDAFTGYTHAATGPDDHFWRLVTAGGNWYFYFCDHSPRED